MCVAKGIGGGFPLGAVLATADAAKGMTAGTHGTTYGGNPLAMAVGNAAVDMIWTPGFLDHVNDDRQLSATSSLAALVAAHPDVFEERARPGPDAGPEDEAPRSAISSPRRAGQGLLTWRRATMWCACCRR